MNCADHRPRSYSYPAVARTRSRLSADIGQPLRFPPRVQQAVGPVVQPHHQPSPGRRAETPAAKRRTANPRTLDIHKHPPSREDGEWAGPSNSTPAARSNKLRSTFAMLATNLDEDECNDAEDGCLPCALFPRTRQRNTAYATSTANAKRAANAIGLRL